MPQARLPKTSKSVITVFGGTGFIGRHVVSLLAKSGATIRVATRVPARGYFLRLCGHTGQIVPVACDLHDDASIAQALKGATHAVYLPGILAPHGKRNSFKAIHAAAVERVARACHAQGVHTLVHMSALGADAQSPSAYARSKAEGEQLALRAFSGTVILRPSVVYGNGDNFFNRFAALARRFHCVPVVAGGKTLFQPVHVGDVAQAVARILLSPEPRQYHGRVFSLAGPDTYSYRQMMELMLAAGGQKACILSLPRPVAQILAALTFWLPQPPLTRDQIRNLSRDNTAPADSAGFEALGITPAALTATLPEFMWAYRPGGRFARN